MISDPIINRYTLAVMNNYSLVKYWINYKTFSIIVTNLAIPYYMKLTLHELTRMALNRVNFLRVNFMER